jgi:hypothetical protein
MDMNAAYREVGSYRAAAQLCGTTPKTVMSAVAAPKLARRRRRRTTTTRCATIVAERVAKTQGLISAKRLLSVVRAAGYQGSARNLRRLVAQAKAAWRSGHHRNAGRGVGTGRHVGHRLGQIGGLMVFCAVLAWSRFRFVCFADNQRAETTFAALAACFGTLGGVPKSILSDRMGCLKGGTVAGVVIPTPDNVRWGYVTWVFDECSGREVPSPD